jgi:hypothetical protein
MKTTVCMAVIVTALLWTAWPVLSQELIIFPKEGQSQQQMEQDKFTCYSWAKAQSGFDPMQAPQASSPSPQQQASQGEVVKGAARGALLGVTIGAIAGDAGKGAAIGAASGGLLGGMRSTNQKRQQQQAQEQWAQQQAQAYNQKRNTYNRAYGACLEAKGYTVK